jgi:DNA-directed RNA polymerase beta subunit
MMNYILLHIERYEVEVRDTITGANNAQLPMKSTNVDYLDHQVLENRVQAGDILVGK